MDLAKFKSDLVALNIPKLYANENKSLDEALVVVKLVHPPSGWAWWVSEWDGDRTFFGFVVGLCPELGYFDLLELYANDAEIDTTYEPRSRSVMSVRDNAEALTDSQILPLAGDTGSEK